MCETAVEKYPYNIRLVPDRLKAGGGGGGHGKGRLENIHTT